MLKELDKPAEQHIFTVQEIADALDCSCDIVRNLANYYHIEHNIVPNSKSRQSMFDYQGFKQIKDIYEQRKNKTKKVIKNAAPADASEEEHPLVKDKRCLKMGFWPETVPSCFEVEEE